MKVKDNYVYYSPELDQIVLVSLLEMRGDFSVLQFEDIKMCSVEAVKNPRWRDENIIELGEL